MRSWVSAHSLCQDLWMRVASAHHYGSSLSEANSKPRVRRAAQAAEEVFILGDRASLHHPANKDSRGEHVPQQDKVSRHCRAWQPTAENWNLKRFCLSNTFLCSSISVYMCTTWRNVHWMPWSVPLISWRYVFSASGVRVAKVLLNFTVLVFDSAFLERLCLLHLGQWFGSVLAQPWQSP